LVLSTFSGGKIIGSISESSFFDIPHILVSFSEGILVHWLIICVDSHGCDSSVLSTGAICEHVTKHFDVLWDFESWHQWVCFPVKVVQC
jgi:hypothetical protein